MSIEESKPATATDVAHWTATQLASAIRRRELSAGELLAHFLARIERLNPRLRAVVTLDAERATATARAADDAAGRGEWWGPLHGLPITVKDAIETAGLRSTGGAMELWDHHPVLDAPAVARLKRAGAIVFGKTNVPRWSEDIQTFNEMFGTTKNPWNLARTPGGSSGGSAAAVAAGLTSFELGTDIGGSIRIPSHFCGVHGHKPSFGLVSQRGCLSYLGSGVTDADLNVVGPLARSVDDLELLLGVLAGPDAELAAAWHLQLPRPRHAQLSAYRVGTWFEDADAEIDVQVRDLLRSAADTLADAGATVTTDRPPFALPEIDELYRCLLAAASAPLRGAAAAEVGGSHAQWLVANGRRARMRRVWADWFQEHDVLLCPVYPTTALPHDHRGGFFDRTIELNGQVRPQADTLRWLGLPGLCYLPSTVVPVGLTREGMPVGIQVVAPYLEDLTGLFVARHLAVPVGPPALPHS